MGIHTAGHRQLNRCSSLLTSDGRMTLERILKCFITCLLLTTSTVYGRRLEEAKMIRINGNNNSGESMTNMIIGNLPTSVSMQEIIDKVEDESLQLKQMTIHNGDSKGRIIIPESFRKADEDLLLRVQNYTPFPRWSHDSNDPSSVIDSIVNFVTLQNDFYDNYLQNKYDDVPFSHLPMNRTSDHPWGVVNGWWPETLYILSKNGLYGSNTPTNITDRHNTGPYHEKKTGTDKIMLNAYNILTEDDNDASLHMTREEKQQRWPHLYKTILENNSSVPFLAHYSDYTGCNYHNWNDGKSSIPLFTVAASIDCSYTFPFPNSYDHTKPNRNEWKETMDKQKETYGPLSERIQKVVWRGTLTGYFNETARPPRYNLMKFVNSPENLSESNRLLFDIHFNGFSFSAKQYVTQHEIDNQLGGVNDHWFYEQDFQFYKAILDIDGHSWSSRFGSLLCYDSIVLKVQPEWVDYFYYTKNESRKVLPWKHYIPISADFSDLVEKTKYVMDPKNEDHIQEIITNANDWCIERMLPEIIATDALDIWESYLEVLDESSTRKQQDDWTAIWNNFETSIFQPGHPQNIVKILPT